MRLIVGLGNPGAEYSQTRHNLGSMVIDELAGRLGINSYRSKHQSLLAEGDLHGARIILAKPQTFMNNSGLAVRSIMDWYKIGLDRTIIVYDDLDLEPGQIRIREKGSAGGHRGIASIMESLGTGDFIRVRIGIGREDRSRDAADHVLEKIPPAHRELYARAVASAADAVEAILTDGIGPAMNRFND